MMKRTFPRGLLATVCCLVYSGFTVALQPELVTSSPVEVVGRVVEVSGSGTALRIGRDVYRLSSDALVTDQSGLELTRNDLRSGVYVGLVQEGGLVSHIVVYQGEVR